MALRPLPSDAEMFEALGIAIGPITTGTPFSLPTEERAATVILDWGTNKFAGQTPPVAAARMAKPDFHAAVKAMHAAADPNKLTLGGWLQLLQTILGLLGPILGGIGGSPTAGS